VAFVERLNFNTYQYGTAVARRINTLCQGEDGLHQPLALSSELSVGAVAGFAGAT